MAITTATTSTPTPTPTVATDTAGITKNAAQSILTSLNTGSGVDTASLVTSLVQAQFAAKTAALTAKGTALTAQISAASTLKGTIADFSAALGTLTGNGTLQTQPVSSNAAISASATPSGKVGTLDSRISVKTLASAQSSRSIEMPNSSTPLIGDNGTGSFTLTLGTATYNTAGDTIDTFAPNPTTSVNIPITDSSLDGIAASINAAKKGVTASVITDQNGKAVLALRGTTGASQAFTLIANDGNADLAQLNVGEGQGSITAKTADAELTIDGVTVTRSSNAISDLVPGVKLQLNTTTTAPVSLTSTRPTSALSHAVTDFVDTYNQIYASTKQVTNAVDGDLKTDSAAKTLLRSLQGMTTKTLVSVGSSDAPKTLAQIGISTNRDGTLKVDADTLNRVLAAYPDEVEAMFATTSGNALGLNSTLSGISIAASSSLTGLGASGDRYIKSQKQLTVEQAKITTQSDAMTTRLTQQFSSMNSKVSAYKATQTFLENQIKAWNKDS